MDETKPRIGRYALYDLEFYLLRLFEYMASKEFAELSEEKQQSLYGESRHVDTFLNYGWMLIGRGNVRRVVSVDSTGTRTEYSAIGVASRVTGVGKGNIMNVLSGERKAAGGYEWYEIK